MNVNSFSFVNYNISFFKENVKPSLTKRMITIVSLAFIFYLYVLQQSNITVLPES